MTKENYRLQVSAQGKDALFKPLTRTLTQESNSVGGWDAHQAL